MKEEYEINILEKKIFFIDELISETVKQKLKLGQQSKREDWDEKISFFPSKNWNFTYDLFVPQPEFINTQSNTENTHGIILAPASIITILFIMNLQTKYIFYPNAVFKISLDDYKSRQYIKGDIEMPIQAIESIFLPNIMNEYLVNIKEIFKRDFSIEDEEGHIKEIEEIEKKQKEMEQEVIKKHEEKKQKKKKKKPKKKKTKKRSYSKK